jgi:heme exporter protein C
MLAPLLLMALAFTGYYLALMLVRARCELLTRERGSAWVQEIAAADGAPHP